MRVGLMICISAIAVGCMASVCAASVEFDVKASPAELAVGDTLTVDVSLTFPEGDTLYDIAEVPVPTVNGFVMLFTSNSKERVYSEGFYRYVMSTRYLLEAVDTGRTAVPVMTVDYVDRRTGMLTSLASQRVAVHVGGRQTSSLSTIWIVVVPTVIGIATLLSIVMLRRRRVRLDEALKTAASQDPSEALRRSLSRSEVVLAHGRTAEAQSILYESLKQYLKDAHGQCAGVGDAVQESGQLHPVIPTSLLDSYQSLEGWNNDLKYGGTARSAKELTELCGRLRNCLEQ
jgi:hypothetical protein